MEIYFRQLGGSIVLHISCRCCRKPLGARPSFPVAKVTVEPDSTEFGHVELVPDPRPAVCV
jgi:hypothetical protein